MFQPAADLTPEPDDADRTVELVKLLHRNAKWIVEGFDGVTDQRNSLSAALWLAHRWVEAAPGLERIYSTDLDVELRPTEVIRLWYHLQIPA
jgi:hypothetical protein